MKLIQILVEASNRPKVVVMAGGAGAGKSSLRKKLNLGDLPQIDPDKYTDKPENETESEKQKRLEKTRKAILMYFQDNEEKQDKALKELEDYGRLNLNYASELAKIERDKLENSKDDFLLDTTAANKKIVEDLIKEGYDVFMAMVYTHPMNAYISNIARPQRTVPNKGLFDTWYNAYSLIGDYEKLLGDNFNLFINDRDGIYSKEVKEFDKRANNPAALAKYLDEWNEDYIKKHNKEKGSSFRNPIKELEPENKQKYPALNDYFNKITEGLVWDKDNYSVDRAIKAKVKADFEKTEGKLEESKLTLQDLEKIRDKEIKKQEDSSKAKLVRYQDIYNKLQDSNFLQSLNRSVSSEEINRKLQDFLA